MTQWAKPHDWIDGEVDLDLVEESALAAAQSTIQNAVSKTGISRAEMARRMGRDRSFVSRILNGSHNLTIKTMARSLAVCGLRFASNRSHLNGIGPRRTVPSRKNLSPLTRTLACSN